MKSNILESNLTLYAAIPNQWNGWENYRDKTESHLEDGWRDVVFPDINSKQKLGELFYDEINDVVTYNIIDLSEDDIEKKMQNQIKPNKEEVLQQLILKEVEEKIQTLEGDEALDVKDAYPFWEVGIETVTGHKYQAISPDLEEMWLWEAITGHTTQEEWKPKDTPALFKRVGFDGEILVWVQPTGAHDAYNIGDKVKYPTAEDDIWESTVNGNTYAPGVVPGQWTKL